MHTESPQKKLLSAGRFASICGVNKQTLLYYEKMELFLPHYKDSSGRRYYSSEQIDTFHVILALREIMSLTDLKRYMQTREKESFLRLYEQNIQKLSDQIFYLEQSRTMMQKKIELVKEARSVDTSIVYTQYCPREYLKLSPDVRNATNDLSIASALGSTIQYRIENNLYLGRAIGGLLPVAWLYSSRDPGYQYYYSDLALNASPQERFIKPEGNNIIYYHQGDYHTTYLSYPKILAFARQNRFHLEGFVYEESLIDEAVELDPANYITKISIPFTAAHPILNKNF